MTDSEDSNLALPSNYLIIGYIYSDGFCVAERKDLTIFREIFMQVYAPFSLKKREQVNLRIAVFNYGTRAVDVSIVFTLVLR